MILYIEKDSLAIRPKGFDGCLYMQAVFLKNLKFILTDNRLLVIL